jgi:hypothetical protein
MSMDPRFDQLFACLAHASGLARVIERESAGDDVNVRDITILAGYLVDEVEAAQGLLEGLMGLDSPDLTSENGVSVNFSERG